MPQVLEAVSQLRLAAAEAACFQPEATEAPWWADPAAAVIVAAPRQALAREVGSAMVELPRLTAAAEAAAGTAAVLLPAELPEEATTRAAEADPLTCPVSVDAR